MLQEIGEIETLKPGQILDVEDDYSQWNLCVVIEQNSEGGCKVHPLPYDNPKRDEWLDNSAESKLRTAMAFSKSMFMTEEKEEAFTTLREYFQKQGKEEQMIKAAVQKANRSESRANGKRGADSGKPHNKPLPTEFTGRTTEVPEDSALQN